MTGVDVTLKTASGSSQKADITFASGTDDEFVHHYEVTVSEKGGAVLKTLKILSDFYRHPKTADMKTSWTLTDVSLMINKTYIVSVKAIDSWGAESTPVTKEFETAKGTVSGALPAAYVDIDFTATKTAVDSKNNVTIELKEGAAVEQSEVKVGTNIATLPALLITQKNQRAVCTFKNLTTPAAFKEWDEKRFTVEAFYVMGQKNGVQGVVCGTEYGGWGVAENAGKPYFITGSGTSTHSWNTSASAAAPSSTTELVHVVAVYDYASKMNIIYINGQLAQTTTIKDTFFPGTNDAFNKFCLGADYMAQTRVTATTPVDYPSSDMTMVDAKIYASALNSEQVLTAYNNAVESIKPAQ